MSEQQKPVYPELSFQYMVLQGWMDKNCVFFYLDGSQSRRLLNIPAFLQMFQDKWPELSHDVYEAIRTTSFFLFSVPDKKITHLFPQANDALYNDNVRQIMNDKKVGKETKHFISDKKSIEETLMSYGFTAPTDDSIQNLRVSMEKKDPATTGFLSRFLNRGKQ